MSKQFKIILLVLLGIFVILQIIPNNKPNNEPVEGFDFFSAYNVPDEVEIMIRTSCFDCHSQEVYYPWYAYVAPVSWLVSRDVRMGRANLDFSRWNELDKKEKIKIASEIGEEVDMGMMPMAIYVFMHKESTLDRADRDLLLEWSELLVEKIFEE